MEGRNVRREEGVLRSAEKEGIGEVGGREDAVEGLLMTFRVMCREDNAPSSTHDLESWP